MSIVENALKKAGRMLDGSRRSAGQDISQTQPFPNLPSTTTAERRARVAPRNPILPIDLERLRNLGMLPDGDSGRVQREQLRAIKRRLLRAPVSEPVGKAEDNAAAPSSIGNLIMVTSALPDEGKTYISFNLALSIARERDCHVLLVDADVAKRHMTRLLGLADRRGLIELLKDPELVLDDVIIPTEIPHVSVLPSGSYDEMATELLTSQRMTTIAAGMHELLADHLVLFDSAPLLVSSEAAALADALDQALLVVHAGVTLRDAVQAALGHLNSSTPVGLVLNGWEPLPFASAPTYYYAYGAACAADATNGIAELGTRA